MRGEGASPLHAARAGVAVAWGLVVVTVTLAFEHPAVLGAATAAIVAAGLGAGAGRALARAAMLGLPLALLIALVNPFVVRDGLTVIFRAGKIPPFGQVDLTLEALAYGGVLGLRALAVILACGLLAAAVDADEALRAVRRAGLRSALTAALATRLVPVLARDARRLDAAQRCRPDAPARPGPARRVALARAVATGALDRAVDVAATLELRGYAGARRPGRERAPWSRHDVAFAASAVALLAVAVAAKVAGVAPFDPYPRLDAPLGAPEALLAGALVLAVLAPFADRRGIAR